MRKIYKIADKPRNNASFYLVANGMRIKYNFNGGNVIANVAPTFTTENQFYQKVLEDSDLFKNGIIKVYKTIKTAEDDKPKEDPVPQTDPIEEVKTIADAIDYIADKYGKKLTSSTQVKAFAKEQGISFPNLVKAE